MLYRVLPAPVELGHGLFDKRAAQMLFEVVAGRYQSGPIPVDGECVLPAMADHLAWITLQPGALFEADCATCGAFSARRGAYRSKHRKRNSPSA